MGGEAVIDIAATGNVVSLIIALIALGTTVWNFVMSGARANGKRIDTQEKDIERLRARVGALEGTVAQMPGKEDTHRLEMTLAEMAGDMKAMSATMTAMNESLGLVRGIVSRHEDHLRGNGR